MIVSANYVDGTATLAHSSLTEEATRYISDVLNSLTARYPELNENALFNTYFTEFGLSKSVST